METDKEKSNKIEYINRRNVAFAIKENSMYKNIMEVISKYNGIGVSLDNMVDAYMDIFGTHNNTIGVISGTDSSVIEIIEGFRYSITEEDNNIELDEYGNRITAENIDNNRIESFIDSSLVDYAVEEERRRDILSQYQFINGVENLSTEEKLELSDNILEIIEQSHIANKSIGKEEDINEPKFEDIIKWSEGNEHLQALLESCRNNNVPSMFCCAGHGRGKPAYLTVQMNEDTMGKIYNIMNSLVDRKDIVFNFAQKEFGKDPSFSVYMKNDKNKNEIMDIISESMTQEQQIVALPANFQKIVQLSNLFSKNGIGFNLTYNIGRTNELALSNLKFANNQYLEQSDFKNMGFKIRKDVVGNKIYKKSGIRHRKHENETLDTVLDNFQKIYNDDYNIENDDEKQPRNFITIYREGARNFIGRIGNSVKRMTNSISGLLSKSKTKELSPGRKEQDNYESGNTENEHNNPWKASEEIKKSVINVGRNAGINEGRNAVRNLGKNSEGMSK